MKYFTPLLFLLTTFQVSAQLPNLSLDEAIKRALSQQLGIKIAQNDVQIAKNNAVREAVGFMPTVNLVAGTTPSFGYINQKLSNGNEINRANTSNNLTGSVQLAWTLYDGKRMFVQLDRLKEVQALGEVNVRVQMERVVYDVMRNFYNVARQQEIYKSLSEQMDLYEERQRLAQTRLEVGKGNQLDVLQAKSDLDIQKTQLLRQKQAIDIAKLQLKQILADDPSVNFNIQDSLVINKLADFNALKTNVLGQNMSLELLKKQLGIATLNLKETETLLKPRVNLNSAFNLGRQDNTAGLFLVNQNFGLNAGVTLTKPLYDAGNAKRQKTNAAISIESVKLQTEQAKIDLINALNLSYQTYLNAVEIAQQEAVNREVSQQAIVIAMERFRLSRSTVLELKQIQQVYEAALVRMANARYEAKLAEIDVLRLSGQLVR